MSGVAMQFRIVVYPSEDDDGGRFTAHCLNLDVIADDDAVEGAVAALLETIEVTILAAEKHGVFPFHDAPREYWAMLARSKPLAEELRERIIRGANKRLGVNQPAPFDVKTQCDMRQLQVV